MKRYTAKQIHDLIERAAAGWDEMAEKRPGGPEEDRADTLRRWVQAFIAKPEGVVPSITLVQWLGVDPNRSAPLHVEGTEVCVQLLGENLTWRGRGKDEDEAIQQALLAREKVHGAAL